MLIKLVMFLGDVIDAKAIPQYGSLESTKRQFTYSEILKMTNNFERVLGKGVELEPCIIAIKMLSASSVQGFQQFHAEGWSICIVVVTCKPPIMHRDVKSTNILLNESFQAKISDFGLSRNFPIHDGTHASSFLAGTPGYLDPDIVDPRLEGNFNTNSVWKAVEIAMACVSVNAIKRPSMSQVVVDLKECLATEYARTKHSRVGEFENPNELMPDNSIARLTPSVR
ncbi:putative LRR receptor-like serine/threonine-protein kinase [Prunus yedoensis var. nudiflora]|uniref:Putative LRR receptor-like serine/threonine-protein kinase n=1 Tax=Prunus yedoensis var. nudiflora TaxID=2094558 RepID=A0A314UED1_PRUYE|nr:putative LRR receptor-like serine/threonine-protein kinase [Prunus yedoensis var. nudiflora]